MSSGHFDVSQNVANKSSPLPMFSLVKYIHTQIYTGRRSKYRIVAGLCTLEECGHLLHKRRSLPGQGYKRQTFDILSNNKYELI